MNIVQKNKLFSIILFITFVFYSFGQSNSKFKVALDAGHGAHDFGAVYNGHIEKNITLAIVLKVGKILESNPKIDVIYTRKKDVFIELVERSNIANRADANIFVSIHCNANKNTAAEGTETYVMGLNKNASNLAVAKSENAVVTLEKDYKQKYDGYDPKSPESMFGMNLMQEEYLDNSISLASKIEENFGKLGKVRRGDGGVKQAGFMVLHKAYMPRVLVETGFISNPTEGDILNSEEGQNDVARAIAEAILSYKRDYFWTGAPEVIESKPLKDSTPVKPKVVEAPVLKNTPKGTFFKVQLIASIKKTPLEPKNFKGLNNISMLYENNIYKYFYQETSDYNTAQKYLQEAKNKGYGASFLIAIRDGEKISIQDAIK